MNMIINLKVVMEAFRLFLSNGLFNLKFYRFIASRGDNGTSSRVRGRRGEDVVVEVPPGTVASDMRTGHVICDVDTEDKRYLLQVRVHLTYIQTETVSPYFLPCITPLMLR